MMSRTDVRGPTDQASSDNKNVLLYARQSVNKLTSEMSYSIESQLEAMRSYAEKRDLHIIAEYSEIHSARTLDRPIFNEVRERMKADDVNYLIVDRLDRLTRGDIGDVTTLLDEFKNNDLTLLTVRMDLNTETADGRFSLMSMALLNNYQIGLIKENQESVRRAQLSQHKAISSKAPLGYYYDNDTGRYLINSEEAQVVMAIFKLHVNKGLGGRKICTEINDTFGTDYPLHIITTVLKNASKYAGHYHNDKYGDFENVYPKIISDDTYKTSEAIRAKQTFPRNNEFWLLRRKIVCPYCGRRLTTHQVRQFKYYYCVKNGEHKVKGTININAEPINKLVLSSVMFAINSNEAQELLLDKIKNEQNEIKQVDQHKRQSKTRRANTLMKKFESGNIDAEELQTKLKKLDDDINNMEKTKLSLQDQIEKFNQFDSVKQITINKMIDRVEVINDGMNKYLTGIYIKGNKNNLIKAKVKIN